MERAIKQFDIFWAKLDPTVGAELQKTRPCVIISPNDLNQFLKTVLIAPLTGQLRTDYAYRPQIQSEKPSQVAIDQIRCIDKSRLTQKIGTCSPTESRKISDILVEMFRLEA